MHSINVPDFVTRCVELAGGAIERYGDVMEALIPAEIAGEETLWTLALTPEALVNRPQADLAILGSPTIDRLIAYAASHGRTATGRLDPGIIRRKNLREIIEQELVFSHCRVRYDETPIRVSDYHYAFFDYRLIYVSDEKRERVVTIPVDLGTARVNRDLAKQLEKVKIGPARLAALADPASVRKAHDVARGAVQTQAREDAETYTARMQKRFEVEHMRISDYFDQMETDLRKRLIREADPEKRQTLERKSEGVRTEKTTKVAELAEKYRIRPRADLTSAQIVAQEKSAITIQIDRKQVTRPLTLVYDSLLQRLEPPLCEQCLCEMTRIWVNDQGLRLCPDCSGKA